MQHAYCYRVKEKHAAGLKGQTRAANAVWNFCNETQQKTIRFGLRPTCKNNLWKVIADATKERLEEHSYSAMRIGEEYAKARQRHKKRWSRQRGRKSPGWVPFNTGYAISCNGWLVSGGEGYEAWLHGLLAEGTVVRANAFSQDSRGHWDINCSAAVPEVTGSPHIASGLAADVGTKDVAALPDGGHVAMPRFRRKSAKRPAASQRHARRSACERSPAGSRTDAGIFRTKQAQNSRTTTGWSSLETSARKCVLRPAWRRA